MKDIRIRSTRIWGSRDEAEPYGFETVFSTNKIQYIYNFHLNWWEQFNHCIWLDPYTDTGYYHMKYDITTQRIVQAGFLGVN